MISDLKIGSYELFIIAIQIIAVITLLVLRYRRLQRGVKNPAHLEGISKMIAATCFIWIAVTPELNASSFAKCVLLGLLFSWLGDLFLLSSKSRFFQFGILAFLIGHMAYASAFLLSDPRWMTTAWPLFSIPLLTWAAWAWLGRHVEGIYRWLVPVYLVAISTMLVVAFKYSLDSGAWVFVVAALCFAVSDLFVAKERFIKSSFSNALFGIPLYFIAQLLFALGIR